MQGIDAAFEIFKSHRQNWELEIQNISSEQDARFRIVNHMLIDVLGWHESQIKTEPHVDSGYIDYLMTDGDRNLFLVEAKKISILLIDSKSSSVGSYKYSSPAITSASEAIKQAERYCFPTGTPFCCVTNGIEWIAHWAIRGDGRKPSDFKLITFPNLDLIEKNFAKFHDLFSFAEVKRKTYKAIFLEAEGLRIGAGEHLRPIRDPRESKKLVRSELARDLDPVFRAFFASMSGEDDPEMLARCFVESKESKEAEASLEKIAKNLIENIKMVTDRSASRLQSEIHDAVAFSIKEFALIIGNKGAGKSTFINRFFDHVLDPQLRSKCLLLKVDLRDSDGNISGIHEWLTEQFIGLAEASLFSNAVISYDDLQGLFFRQYQQWSQGEFKHLYETDKSAFKIKFGEYIHSIRNQDRKKYLDNLLWHATGARNLMPCLIFDNTDHYPQGFQETVFQYAQGLHRSIFSFVICPITDRTIWQLSKSGPLQSYETKAFYLPVPSTRDVLEARVSFIKEKLNSPEANGSQQYFLQKGIRLSIKDLQAFAACIEEVFINTEYVSRAVSWLCNFDIRRSLLLTGKVLASPHISIDDLVKTYLSGNHLQISESIIRRALFLDDYNQFSQDNNDFVLNMFSVDSEQLSTPFTRLSILQLLKNRDAAKEDVEDSYMMASEICSYLEVMGIHEAATLKHLNKLLTHRCIEPYDPTVQLLTESTRMKITSSGQIHIEFALSDHTYMEHVALMTEVRESSTIDEVRSMFSGSRGKFTGEDWRKSVELFSRYCEDQDKGFCTFPSTDAYKGQLQFRLEFVNRWAP